MCRKIDTVRETIEYNRKVLYHVPAKYKYLNHYLNSSIRDTLMAVYKFVDAGNIMVIDNQYTFFCDTSTLTHKVRRKETGRATTNKHMNLLCAIGLLKKKEQNRENENKLTEINKIFLRENPDKKYPINFYSFVKYTDVKLKWMDTRAKRLYEIGVTVGSFSYNKLAVNGCEDLAKDAMPTNNMTAPDKKAAEFEELMVTMKRMIASQGYVTRQQLQDAGFVSATELNRLFSIFKNRIEEVYDYHMPTRQQQQRFQLQNRKYIYTRKR